MKISSFTTATANRSRHRIILEFQNFNLVGIFPLADSEEENTQLVDFIYKKFLGGMKGLPHIEQNSGNK